LDLVNGGNISGATSATLTINPVTIADASSNYYVVITGSCSPVTAAISISLIVNTTPVIITQPTNQIECEGSPASFSVVATGAVLTYQWRKGTVNLTDGGSISGATTATLTIDPVSVSDVASDYNVVISGACSLVITSVDASLTLCGFTDVTTIENGKTNRLVTIYPNPFKTSINIIINDSTQIKKVELSIYDILGVEVMKTILTKKSTTLGTGNLPTGIYFYKVIDNNITIQSGKLICNQ
jgi:hypothetical protein